MIKFFPLLIILLSFGVSACSFGGEGRPLAELERNDQDVEYRVRIGDTLSVEVWGEPRLSGNVFIRDDGKFTLPLVEEVKGEGKTLKEVGAEVDKKLAEFVPGASVAVSLVQSAPVRYYLSGSFVEPGEYRSNGSITLLQAIATGGGFAPFADESEIVLIRKAQGGDIRYSLDYNRVVDGREPNPELQDGDVIAVR